MALVRQDKTSRRRNQPVVTVAGHAYLVTMADRSTHRVSKDRRCDCPQGARCPAVRAVARYLRAGGRRAPDPLP
ncbi:MAG: hypothetical protein KKB13_04135, partial [Chloroflexi bacterium]|nr:hypothetical protein [Chloroflexota bacterium]